MSSLRKYAVIFFLSFVIFSYVDAPAINDEMWKPRYLRKIEREDKKREKQKKKDYIAAIKENKQRSLEIQTPEVRKRMIQNVKDANKKATNKRKSNLARTRHNAKKHR